MTVECSKLSPCTYPWHEMVYGAVSLFLVSSLSWVWVQSCERAKKLDLGGCLFLSHLIIWSMVDTVSLILLSTLERGLEIPSHDEIF